MDTIQGHLCLRCNTTVDQPTYSTRGKKKVATCAQRHALTPIMRQKDASRSWFISMFPAGLVFGGIVALASWVSHADVAQAISVGLAAPAIILFVFAVFAGIMSISYKVRGGLYLIALPTVAGRLIASIALSAIFAVLSFGFVFLFLTVK